MVPLADGVPQVSHCITLLKQQLYLIALIWETLEPIPYNTLV